MDFCFSKRELSFLDDLMPERKKRDDAKNEAREEEVTLARCSGLGISLGLWHCQLLSQLVFKCWGNIRTE